LERAQFSALTEPWFHSAHETPLSETCGWLAHLQITAWPPLSVTPLFVWRAKPLFIWTHNKCNNEIKSCMMSPVRREVSWICVVSLT